MQIMMAKLDKLPQDSYAPRDDGMHSQQLLFVVVPRKIRNLGQTEEFES